MNDAVRPNRVLRWLRIAGLAVACVITLEIAARVDDRLTYGAPITGTYDMDQMFEATVHGLRGVPDASYVKWSINPQGFRGPPVRPMQGQTRVVAYGASETFGIYETPGNEFPRVLERDLNAKAGAGRFEVINAGLPGMRVGSGISYLDEIGRAYSPSVVIIYPTPTHYVGVTRPYCGRPPSVPPRAPGFSPRILAKIKDRLKTALPPAGLTLMRKAGIALATRGAPVIDKVDPRSLDALDTDLRCALRTVREIGATPIVVTHASRFGHEHQSDDDYWLTGWRLQYPEIQERVLLSLEAGANERIVAVAKDEHVAIVDASTALGGKPANFADHAHFNDAGAALMGALLTPAVLAVVPAAHNQPGS